MTNYHERKFKDDPFMWAYEEFQRDSDYWLDRAKNGKGLIKEVAEFVVRNGKPQQERKYPLFLKRQSRPLIVASRRKFTNLDQK